MKLRDLQTFFKTSPSVKLLRAGTAPYVIEFLFRQFKTGGRITIPETELLVELRAYRDEIQETEPDALVQRPEDYLNEWCHEDSRYLTRYYDKGSDEAQFQLTPHTEDVIQFLDRAVQKDLGSIATESRIRLVLQKLEEIVIHASDDPEGRLQHLQEKKCQIEAEMNDIQRTGDVLRYEAAQIRELFFFVLRQLKELLGDFRMVEERFKSITREVQKRQIAESDSRGGLLGFALDEEDCLKQDDQGVSFYAFVSLILSPKQQSQLQERTARISELKELSDHNDGLRHLHEMVPMLLAEARKIMSTNQRLTTALRRLLDEDAVNDRRRLRHLLKEIKGLATRCVDNPPKGDFSIEIDHGIAISNPFHRTFWNPPQTFDPVSVSEHSPGENKRGAAFRMLAQMARLDWKGMRDKIRQCLDAKPAISLPELVGLHPPKAGAVELLGYLQIARQDDHYVDADLTDEIRLEEEGKSTRVIDLPHVVFRNQAKEE